MKHRLIVAAIVLAGPAAFAADATRCPSAAFKALPLSERNLAVYDAFWENLESNHYDRQLLSRAEVRAMREQGRRKAAAADHPSNLYGEVFSSITSSLADPRVRAELPAPAEAPAPRRYSKSPEEAQRMAELLFGGPGFDETTMRRGSKDIRVVTEVRRGSAAGEAGIQPGWRVLSYNANVDRARNTLQITGEFLPLDPLTSQAWERGDLPVDPPDSRKVLRISYTHRGLAARAPVEHRRLGKALSYLRFDDFGDDEYMRPVYQALREAGPDGLIIDLRWNNGGHLHQAQKVAGMLLGETIIGYQKDARGSEAIRATQSAPRYQGPLAVLIGPGSSSSSEILAAAIQEHRRGKLVGRMTNGSLARADVFMLPDGGILRVPTRDYLSSRQKRLDGVGVTPDVRVLPTLEDIQKGRDPTLDRAVRILRAAESAVEPARDFLRRRGEVFPPI